MPLERFCSRTLQVWLGTEFEHAPLWVGGGGFDGLHCSRANEHSGNGFCGAVLGVFVFLCVFQVLFGLMGARKSTPRELRPAQFIIFGTGGTGPGRP